MARVGRPPKPTSEVRINRHPVYFNEVEERYLEAEMQRTGLDASTLIRSIFRNKMETELAMQPDTLDKSIRYSIAC